MEKRTCLDFSVNGDIQGVVDSWAQQNGFTLKSQNGSEKLYQKGVGFLVAPTMFMTRMDGQNVHIESWIRINLFTRICSLFLMPAEIGIQSGGIKAVVPRTLARDTVNELLGRLGVPYIR